jgi:hypothetical protein
MMDLEKTLKAVCRLEVFKKDYRDELFDVGEATGFFYKKRDKLYLITNKHVVFHKKRNIERYMDVLRIYPPIIGMQLTLQLREKDGRPLWKKHSDEKTDVIALEIPKERIKEIKERNGPRVELLSDDEKSFSATAFSEKDFLPEEFPTQKIPLALMALVLGYPLGFHDEKNPYPIVRSATVATHPRYEFLGEECFLIDATLHEGMSGSPVVSHPEFSFGKKTMECVSNLSKLKKDENEKKKLRDFLTEQLSEILSDEDYPLLREVGTEWMENFKVKIIYENIIHLSPSTGNYPKLMINGRKNKITLKTADREERIFSLSSEMLQDKLRIYREGFGNVYLLGIFSSEWVVLGEQLGLHNVWHANLIKEILIEDILELIPKRP